MPSEKHISFAMSSEAGERKQVKAAILPAIHNCLREGAPLLMFFMTVTSRTMVLNAIHS